MKKVKMLCTLAALMFGIGLAANAQCSDDDVLDGCSNELKAGFRYLKTYDVDGDGEFSYVFSRGNTYLIQTCEEASLNKNVKITVMDRTKHKIAANYDRAGTISNSFLAYRCNSTSIYYVKFEIVGDDPECGVGILGFK